MIRASLLALALAAWASAAVAQEHQHGQTSGQPQTDPHAAHQPPPAATGAPQPEPEAATDGSSDPHAGHVMPAAPADNLHAEHAMPAPATGGDEHAGHDMAAPSASGTAAELPVGSAAAPPVITDSAADAVFGKVQMDRSRAVLANEHGGAPASKVMVDILEYQFRDGQDGYRWNLEAWWGGDLNRLVLKSEGEGANRDGVEAAEVQALYSRAVGRYTDLQAGVRQDLEPRGRTYATVGFESVFPYWFEAEGALFLSDKGDLLGRLDGSYDLRLTQRLVLQPRAELLFAAQDIPETLTGSGLSRGEFDLRLRYEIRRAFAPYIGVSYERAFGDTADFVRAHGDDMDSTSIVVGLRTWF